ncbi:tetratricopeptide repeat protein [Vreelandella rituensis]|uniref:Tetratricopeptide repeat protein n=1 Tax=Vreelandella rituensis TaxID=2282306 RepID=A0A368TZX8_9GAMM|nr:tetratricopeptide repeat protein [Halomonas rituensis]RCV89906.1 tetratricopeptide repeat protein [Halomonas rituensis]
MPSRWTLFPLVAVAVFFSGCQTFTSQEKSQEGILETFPSDPMRSAPPITQGLDAAGLSILLGAELAGQRGDYSTAGRGYLDAAQRYPTPMLAERATLAARFANDPALLEEAATRWRELAPQSDAPARLLADFSLQRGNWQESLEQRLNVAGNGGYGNVASFAETALAENAPLAPLVAQLRAYLANPGVDAFESHSDVLLGTALLEAAIGDTQSAMRRLDQAATLTPEEPSLWLTRANLALQNQDPATARRAAKRGLELSPDDARFILLLTQAEARLGNIAAAEAYTDGLLEQHAGSQSLRMALAQLYLEEGYPEPAGRLLQPLVAEQDTPPLAYYLLGAITQHEDDVDNALLYYRQVEPGEEFMPARIAAARMLIENDRLLDARAFLRIERMRFEEYFSELVMLEASLLDELDMSASADALLDRELGRTPDDTQLLYMRAMRAWEDGDLAAMERDLRRILKNDPDNAMALNALGYTLADLGLTDRLEEARELIERAYQQEPDNPAVLDSLGWVHYRQGDPQQALPWLERAYALMPDQEIAAHLAEVLHALGRTSEARQVIQEVMQRFSDYPQIEKLLERHPQLTPAASTS